MRAMLLACALCVFAASFAVAAEDPQRFVTVEGTGSVTAIPDMARINMAVQARHLEMALARERVVEVTREFLELVGTLDIEEADVQTSGLTIHPEYRWDEKANQQELQGYLVRRQLDVELKDLSKLGELMEGAANVGVNEVSPPRLMSSRERELHREALAEAARDAEASARLLAQTLNVELGSVREITATQNMLPPPMYRMQNIEAMAVDANAAETYTTGDIRFEANVTATFDLLTD